MSRASGVIEETRKSINQSINQSEEDQSDQKQMLGLLRDHYYSANK